MVVRNCYKSCCPQIGAQLGLSCFQSINSASKALLQILDVNPEDEAEEDGANVDLDSQRKGKCVVLKTSTRQVSMLDIRAPFFFDQAAVSPSCLEV